MHGADRCAAIGRAEGLRDAAPLDVLRPRGLDAELEPRGRHLAHRGMLRRRHGRGRTAQALIAASSSASGLIEFMLNPVLGKLADIYKYGRKGVYYMYIGPLRSGVVMT